MKTPAPSLAKAPAQSNQDPTGNKPPEQMTELAEAVASPSEKRPSETSITPQAAHYILIGLMFPNVIMPLASSMSRVALPIIRDDFQIPADTTAWVATAFTLPFMILMPVYGRLSDGVGRRRLLLAGIVIFAIGTTMTVTATELAGLMIGRMIQGIGTAGIMPLGYDSLCGCGHRHGDGGCAASDISGPRLPHNQHLPGRLFMCCRLLRRWPAGRLQFAQAANGGQRLS